MATVSSRVAVAGWHELVADDVEPEEAFYADLFGWSLVTWQPGEADYPTAVADGRPQAGFLRLAGRRPHWLTYVRVPDVDRAAARVVELGGRVHAGPEEIPDVGSYVVCADPQGALFAASGPPGAGAPHDGAFAWEELMTSDVAGAERFYGELFGWTATAALDGYDVFRSEGVDVAAVLPKPPELEASVWLPYVRVDDADASVRRARGLGATLVAGPHELEHVGRWAVLLDPGGAAFGVFEGAR
jgi:predicted enzyme related to lactoylglutathione lyase